MHRGGCLQMGSSSCAGSIHSQGTQGVGGVAAHPRAQGAYTFRLGAIPASSPKNIRLFTALRRVPNSLDTVAIPPSEGLGLDASAPPVYRQALYGNTYRRAFELSVRLSSPLCQGRVRHELVRGSALFRLPYIISASSARGTISLGLSRPGR